ncbi:non-homologous end-joining DNA ligase [Stackebrandtia nassauensis]|uniref:DNA polymerase LigD, polymerase domain protein n=1 Tax=Stackebrandtia nassauensis (strain DSM 44728 / CIP 108903 / NRRL B-16338 / NBRC 102104 / LLR-40K-21) TaxID=446470 RepID=D3Q8A4_STANL|nr:non-homologous end-joining DNA ligase [Stackebrandtia nassauensis]ADD42478.1 DNA polymerase LigD, polymerase domain protein [Stackebrandtia nassauensis DSM 44728]
MAREHRTITVDGYDIEVTNPEKVMYPDSRFTKQDVVDYYLKVASVLLPHIRNRPLTRIRFPDGTGGESFFEKNAQKYTPSWIRTETVATPGSTKGRASVDYIVAEKPATLAWLANQAALELHVPQWRFDGHEASDRPDRLVADLDPGKGAGLRECVEVAQLLRERFEADGLTVYVKASGKSGVHLCCPIAGSQGDDVVSGYAKAVANDLAAEKPKLVTAKMAKAEREGRVFIDWSQNNAAKTTVAPYSLRNRAEATVSAPLTWEELDSDKLTPPGPDEVLERVAEQGDLWADVLKKGPKVPG